MTMTAQVSRTRLCLPVHEWSPIERQRWKAAKTSVTLLDDGGSRAARSHHSNREMEKGWGRYKSWDAAQEDFDLAVPVHERIIPKRIAAYVSDLEKVNSVSTVVQRLIELKVMAEIVANPDSDWSWIYRIASRVRSRCEPARSKRDRLRDINELWSLGLELMDGAEKENTPLRDFKMYRDGLLIALLSALPTLRLANLTGLFLGHTLLRQGENWLISIPAPQVKTKVAIELLPWPLMLIPHLEVYLSEYRRRILELRHRSPSRSSEEALWVTMYGLPMHAHAVYMRIVARTRDAFGRSVNPHLFRDCAATTIAIEDPTHVRIAAPLLHHRTFATTEKYYNQAQGLEASRAVQDCLLSLRQNAKRPIF